MKTFIIGLILFSCHGAFGAFVDPATYEFTEADSFKATIGTAVLNPGRSRHEDLSVQVRERPELRRRESRLQVRFFPGPETSPLRGRLLHFIVGLGGDDMGSLSNYLATLAQRSGLSVIVYPNSLTENFSLAASRTGIVGSAATDAKDYVRVMDATLKVLERRGHAFDEHYLVGYSHGGLLSAFVKQIDDESGTRRFSRVLLMNPPVNLLYGVRKLDGFSREYGFSLRRLVTTGLSSLRLLKRAKHTVTSAESQRAFLSRLRLSKREERGLIGKLLMSSLPATIGASQRITDLGILRRTDEGFRIPRISFERYIDRFFSALQRRNNQDFSIDTLNTQNSLTTLEGNLRKDASISIIHNLDDFLLGPGDAAWIDGVFGDRALLYPRGGHLGNVYVSHNQNAFRSWLVTGNLPEIPREENNR